MDKVTHSPLIRIKGAAEMLECADKTVRRFIQRKILETVKIAGIRYVKRESLDRVMRDGAKMPDTEEMQKTKVHDV